jgi:hypothetical protein
MAAVSPGRFRTGTKWLSHATTGVTLVATSSGVLGDYAYYTVPKGVGIVIPGQFVLILELKVSGTKIAGTSELYFGFRVPTEPRRTVPLGGAHPYQPWYDLTIAQQRDMDNQAALIIDLGIPFLPLVQDEVFALQVYQTSGTLTTSQTIFYIPYQERGVTELTHELALRKQWVGV